MPPLVSLPATSRLILLLPLISLSALALRRAAPGRLAAAKLLGSRRDLTSFEKGPPPAASGLTETDITLNRLRSAVKKAAPTIIEGLRTAGWVYVDNFLSDAFCTTLREEAVGLYDADRFETSQSTRWCPVKNELVFYDKHNVFSMQLNGGEDYWRAPRLHEYTVGLIRAIVPELRAAFPEALLSDTLASNKLAVCTGDGSAYDKHFDNSGLDDVRKVTILYYMNRGWTEENGGCFRIYNPQGSASELTDIQPQGDRLLCFWSDVLVHSVQPSFAPRGAKDHRYALTVWLTSTSPAAIVRDDEEVKRHFG